MTSMLRDWAQTLPLREQGVLLSGIRGCDLTPKHPLDSTERQLVAYLRWIVCIPNDVSEVSAAPGTYMQDYPPQDWSPSEFGHYPLHWYTHIMHAFQVIGYRHTQSETRTIAREIYYKLVDGLHLEPENFKVMARRLSEERSIELGNLIQ